MMTRQLRRTLDAKPTWTASGATLPKLVNVERAGWGLPEQ
jgi:hypothetical protein